MFCYIIVYINFISLGTNQSMVKVIENYVLTDAIGEGNFGTVYHATNKTKPNQQFAVKVIPIQKFNENQKLETYTSNQIQALSTIGTAENIIKYYEMIKSKHNYYFVYEYCDGGTLMELLKREHRLEEKIALLILKQLIEGFKVLSRNSIMHRDLKPENVFFTTIRQPTGSSQGQSLFNRIKRQRVKIGDFGFCKGLKPEENLAKTMLGSPIYMAPEVLKGESYSSKADIWALGVLLYEMLYGVCPYQSNSIAMLINTIDTRPVILPPDIPVSEKTQNLIKRLLTKDFYRRIGWAELFGYRINQEGEYIEESQSEQKKQQDRKSLNKKVFTSLFVSVDPPSHLQSQNKSCSVKEEGDRQIVSFKNKKAQVKAFYSPTNNKMLDLSINQKNGLNKYNQSNHDSPKIRKEAFSTPKEERRFHSQKYMSILYTPLSLNHKVDSKQNSIDRSRELQPLTSIIKPEVKNSFPEDVAEIQIPSRNRAKTGNIDEAEAETVKNRQEKVMSLVDLKEPKNPSDCLPRSPPNDRKFQYGNYPVQSHQYICNKQEATPTSPTTNIKRQSLLHAHEKIVKILLKTATLMQQRLKTLKQKRHEEKQNKQTTIQDFLHDMYMTLKILQQKLKEITLSIKITETNLLDMASLINYELIQVQRMLIEVRNEIIKSGITMPQWFSTSIKKSYEMGEIDRNWDIDVSGFRVKQIKGFISAQC